ncbi:hypothetical protein C5Y96_17720 [Blastopirellula marina]|uniref:Uncharacterized protein n=1 Tax=Blastopirellula marina TaxID=124 RepID=A0A2S8F5I7_9BACT|nr:MULTISPECIES: hypothetical protein [Pirellulaceae]PQO27380.1 hypothetical protein C5Y96_17720 [Blastopirellula marina]RCS47917.1 hypothetical protein DTL36_17745 [Bremerella cremea]
MGLLFSQHYKIGLTQQDLDFVDIPLDTDIRLYVDPYAFKINNHDWYVDCNNLVVDFFQTLIGHIRDGNHVTGRMLLQNCGEPNETHLGQSSGPPRGRGVGELKGRILYGRLQTSEAAKTGFLKDLSDCVLMIPNFGPDTISDITINVVRGKLIEFTQQQCKALGVPMRKVAAGKVWNDSTSQWESKFAELPVYNGAPLLLVPRDIVRMSLAVDPQSYYQNDVLDYLVQEHMNSNTALVTVLKGGKRKVYKKDVEAAETKHRKKGLKEYLYDFSKDHLDVLHRYKSKAEKGSLPIPTEKLTIILNKHTEKTVIMNGNNSNYVGGDNIGGVVGSGTINAREITAFKGHLQKSQLDDTVKEILIQAREAVDNEKLSEGDKIDVCDELGKMTQELEKPEPDKSRLSKLFDRITEGASSVGKLLTGISAVAEAIGGS